MANISGNLTDPIGTALASKVRIKCLKGSGNVLATAEATITLAAGGAYSFTLGEGDYSIELFSDDQWNEVGTVRMPVGASDGTIQFIIDSYPIPTA